jgi:uncharacterized membrane protein
MKKRLISVGAILATCAVSQACGVLGGKKNSNAAPAPSPQPAAITFATVNTVLANKCEPCHSQAGTKDDAGNQIPLFVGDESVFDPLAATVQNLITTTNQDILMPPPDPGVQPLAPNEKTEILNYLNQLKG